MTTIRFEEELEPLLTEPTKPVLVHTDTVEYWRKQALAVTDRLTYAENQLKDLRKAADDGRSRFGKYKDRLDKANERINDLSIQTVQQAAQIEDLRRQLVKRDESDRAREVKQQSIARRVHEYRETLLSGELWELFAECAVGPQLAGGK